MIASLSIHYDQFYSREYNLFGRDNISLLFINFVRCVTT